MEAHQSCSPSISCVLDWKVSTVPLTRCGTNLVSEGITPENKRLTRTSPARPRFNPRDGLPVPFDRRNLSMFECA